MALQDLTPMRPMYVWLNGRPLARIDNNAQIVYYHVDHLGTPQAMTDAAGATVWKADYDPFGKATVKVGKVENNLRLPGQYYDRETGLHYNYFRDYDPGTGRYVEADPIGLEGGLNLYVYVENDPLNQIDPLGLMGRGSGANGGNSKWGKGGHRQNDPSTNQQLFPGSSCGPEGDPHNFPNNWTGNYEPACQWHDWCYSQCGVSKKYCDSSFHQQMLSSCENLPWNTASVCRNQAWAYYRAVSWRGKRAFDKAQESCQCSK